VVYTPVGVGVAATTQRGGVSPRLRLQLSPREQRLLLMAGLPLLDGVFAGALAGGTLTGPLAALNFGALVFSGAGCFVAAFNLEGGLLQKLISVLRVYCGIILPGALLTAFLLPVVHSLVLPQFNLFSALVLWGLALQLLGVPLVPQGPAPADQKSRWLWAVRHVGMPEMVLAVGIGVSLVSAVGSRPVLAQAVSLQAASFGVLAVGAGLTATLLAAALAGLVARHLDPTCMRRGGGAALVLLGLLVIGVPVPGFLPLVIFLCGLVAGMCHKPV